MEKKYNLSTSQSNAENTNIESIGPSADELKNRFKEGSIPLQTDYSDLIDIADIGRRAVGKAPDQTDNPNSALELDNSSGLKVKINPTGGLKADKEGLSVKLKDKSLLTDADGLAVNTGKGLWINNDKLAVNNYDGIEIVDKGVKVKASNGINVDSNGVSIKLTDSDQTLTGLSLTSSGLKVDDGLGIVLTKDHGVSVGAGNGIQVNTDNIAIKAKSNSGISVDKDGIAVKCWESGGIRVTDSTGIYLKLEGGNTSGSSGTSGLSLSSAGVKVKAGDGINVDANGVSIKLSNSDNTLTGLYLTSNGLKVDDGLGIVLTKDHGVSVGEGNGIQVNKDNVAVKAKNNSGISVDTDGVAVKCWNQGGIHVTDSDGIYLKLVGDTGNHGSSGTSGLSLSTDGVKVKAGHGITVNADGVSVDVSALADLIIPSGTIVPFYGSGSLPNGWVWCDGNNGTPNLNRLEDDVINLISGGNNSDKNNSNYWNLDVGSHLKINAYYMRYIMKK
ncbi:hypothetical protein [Photorhabdus temperata]|uniref:Tail fiber protein n=1 Tax=Photorhabdus temperata J3 TaxID=1389415 RepID=U7QWE3_PHOTE|nr:hypothetical protein [Photorhabdus temperata]EQB98820.1 hypothetical protein B738_22575 [Photorhabdus temperata subsp. temperata M1021]ERT10756.1 hypothetical protein O185_23145 [Photorhabdus temperata J3]